MITAYNSKKGYSKMDLFKKSITILKSLQLDNGAILSTPLDGAYPYVYIRDAVVMTKALNACGLYKNSEDFYYFINHFSKIDLYNEIFHRYTHEGYPCVTRKQEHDNAGLLLHGVYDTYLHNTKVTFLETMWPLIGNIVKLIFSYSRTGLVRTMRSIHEFYRLEHGYDLWANCACCRGLYDAAEMAKILGHGKESKKWLLRAKLIEESIRKKMFNKNLNVFVKNPRIPEIPDISQLAPFYFNIVNSKSILKTTMKFLEKHLWYEELGGFRRFRKFEICEDWHWYTGGSGSWCIFTAWGADFYKQLGNQEKYKECLNWLKNVASKTGGLLPEHITTRKEYEEWKSHEIEFNDRVLAELEKIKKLASKLKNKDIIYWAIPLGWSHAEYILLNKK